MRQKVLSKAKPWIPAYSVVSRHPWSSRLPQGKGLTENFLDVGQPGLDPWDSLQILVFIQYLCFPIRHIVNYVIMSFAFLNSTMFGKFFLSVLKSAAQNSIRTHCICTAFTGSRNTSPLHRAGQVRAQQKKVHQVTGCHRKTSRTGRWLPSASPSMSPDPLQKPALPPCWSASCLVRNAFRGLWGSRAPSPMRRKPS